VAANDAIKDSYLGGGSPPPAVDQAAAASAVNQGLASARGSV